MEKILKTRRLFLRNLLPEDAETMYAYRNDPECYVYQRWEDTSLSFLNNFIGDYAESRFLSLQEEQHYAICACDGTLAGDISCFYTEKDNCMTIGITIAPEHQRKGYAYELLHAVICAVRQQYPKLDIVALIDKENTPSIALFEKLGFYRECYAESIASYVYVMEGIPA